MSTIRRVRSAARSRMLTARSQRDGGAVIMIVALSLVALVAATSFAVDVGRLSARRRDLQKIADVMSLDLLRSVGNSTTASNLVASTTWLTAIQNSASRNGLTNTSCAVSSTSPNDSDSCTVPSTSVTISVTVGQWSGSTFTPSSQTVNGGSDLPGAVRVKAGDTVSYYFSTASVTTSRQAITSRGNPEAWFKVGSFLASLDTNTSKILSPIVAAVLPGAANVTLLGWQGIVSTNITLSLLETALNASLGSPNDLMNSNISVANFMLATVSALQAGGAPTATITAFQALALNAPATMVRVGDILGFQAGGGTTPASTTSINLGQLLLGTVMVADGNSAISTGPITALTIPGISAVTASLSVIQAPQLGGPYEGATATTKQLHLTITPTINVSSANSVNACNIPSSEQTLLGVLLGTVFTVVGCLLGPVLKTLTIGINASVPIDVTSAKATVSQHIDCTNKQLTLTPTELVAAQLNAALTFNITLGSGTLAGVTFSAGAKAQGSASPQVFSATGTGPAYTTFSPSTSQFGSTPLGLKNLLSLQGGTVTLLNAGLPVTFSLLQTAIMPLVNTALGALDQYVITPLAQMLGLDLAGAQVWPLSMNCQPSTPQLAQ
jgi:uncharacterized membrane protein